MKSGLILAFALVAASGTALAQTSESTTTTSTMAPPGMMSAPPAPGAPPVGTLSTTRETHAVDAYGNQVDSKSTSYRNAQGVAQDSQTTTTQVPPPPPPPVSTSTSTTTTTTAVPN